MNPQAVPQCPVATFQANGCSSESQVGVSEVTTELELLPGVKVPVGPLSFPVYDLVPNEGEPGLFGFHVTTPLLEIVNEFVYLETAIEWAGDYHESFFINNIAAFPPLGEDRLVFNGQAGGNFLTLPSGCNAPSSSILELESQAGAKAGPQVDDAAGADRRLRLGAVQADGHRDRLRADRFLGPGHGVAERSAARSGRGNQHLDGAAPRT